MQEEIEEEDINLEEQKEQEQQQQLEELPQKRKMKIFDYLNGKDAKKNRH